ncbi:MAG: hypothetical protein LUC27_02895 [Lachnospiraceae bacterium]|nr:hypothetical protein [Lachnospiraceae bacterium]
MSYTKAVYRSKNAMDVSEYHTGRYGAPGQERQKRKKPTPEQIEKRNQYNKERTAKWKLWDHFDVNDYFSTWTYRKEERPPDMKTAVKDFGKAIKTVKREYKKRGATLKWMRNIEVGTKGAWHIHVIINRIQDTDIILSKAWQHGKIVNQLLYAKGEFRDLAAYITKTPQTDSKLKEANYSTSRNLPLKEREKKIIKWKTWKKVRIPKGFELEKDSLHEGINPVTGYAYRTYTLIRSRRC